jgi:hypothetical protein
MSAINDCGTYAKLALQCPLFPLEVHSDQLGRSITLYLLSVYNISYGNVAAFPKLFNSIEGYQRNRDFSGIQGLKFVRMGHGEINIM